MPEGQQRAADTGHPTLRARVAEDSRDGRERDPGEMSHGLKTGRGALAVREDAPGGPRHRGPGEALHEGLRTEAARGVLPEGQLRYQA